MSRFAVVVRFQHDHPSVGASPGFENTPPLVYWHRSAAAAARRLASLISGRARWVSRDVRCGKLFYVVDHNAAEPQRLSLVDFRREHGLNA